MISVIYVAVSALGVLRRRRPGRPLIRLRDGCIARPGCFLNCRLLKYGVRHTHSPENVWDMVKRCRAVLGALPAAIDLLVGLLKVLMAVGRCSQNSKCRHAMSVASWKSTLHNVLRDGHVHGVDIQLKSRGRDLSSQRMLRHASFRSRYSRGHIVAGL